MNLRYVALTYPLSISASIGIVSCSSSSPPTDPTTVGGSTSALAATSTTSTATTSQPAATQTVAGMTITTGGSVSTSSANPVATTGGANTTGSTTGATTAPAGTGSTITTGLSVTSMTGAGGSSATSSTGMSTASAGGMGGMATLSTGAATDGSQSGEFVLSSAELSEGGAFMDKHTCSLGGFDNDESPPLTWSGAPAAAQSFAIVFLDTTLTDEGNTLGYHWVMWDIPASVTELPANLPEGSTLSTPVSAKQYSPASASYLGPCPNFGSSGETHTYAFTIYAMPEVETAALAGLNDVQALLTAIEQVALDSATLTGTSDASPP